MIAPVPTPLPGHAARATCLLRVGLATALILARAGAAAESAFAGADLGNGKALNSEKRCAACHVEKTQRDEAFIYQHEERRVKTLFDLRRYVSLCYMELKLDLFPEDERDVAAYLNQQFYRLTR